jgi:ATP-binding cassette, subfamily C (CFTR/MRP), member 1
LVFISDYQRARSSDEELPNAFQGFAIAVIMFLASLAQTFILHQYFQLCFEVGLRVRAGLVTIIYNKALALSSGERSRSSGDVVNLQSVDASRLQEICTYGLIGISGPFQVRVHFCCALSYSILHFFTSQIILAFISLYRLLGWPAFVGVAIMVFSIPLNAVVARFLKRMQEAQMKNRDERTRLMSELLNNIRSIKLHAWENAFIRRILVVRNDKELRMLRKIGITTAFNSALWTGIPLLVAFSSFALAALVSSEPLTSDV